VPFRAAIVGGAATTAFGDLAATVEALWAGRSAVMPWPEAAAWDGRPPWAARIPDVRGSEDDPTQRMLGRHGEWLDLCARAAHAQAGFRALPPEDVGLFAALGMVDSPPEDLAASVVASRGADGVVDPARFFAGAYRSIHPLWPLAMLANVAAGHVSIGLDLRGDNVVLASDACAGGRALAEACRALEVGAAQAVLAGGAAEPVTESSLVRRDLQGSLMRAPKPSTAGFAPGEGGAVLALEEPGSARERGARILGWISGSGAAVGDHAMRVATERALMSAQQELADIDLWLMGGLPLPQGTILRTGWEKDLVAAWLASPGDQRWVGAGAALGDLGPAAAAFDVLLALACFERGVPRARSVDFEVEGRLRREPLIPRRALVSSLVGEDSATTLIVEAASCAS
jgi:3-oxoacyl-(acyl-carrier-protein) synthase